jgi:hypothetical protein
LNDWIPDRDLGNDKERKNGNKWIPDKDPGNDEKKRKGITGKHWGTKTA